MKKNTLIFLSICILFIGCTTSKNKIPDWIQETPKGDINYEYFTASGTATNPSDAEQQALNNILGELTRYLGVSISSKSNATITGDTNTTNALITEEINQYAKAEIQNIKIKNKHFYTKKNKTTAYLLAMYDKRSLEKEKARLQALIKEQEEAISIPLQEGDRLLSEEKPFEAFKKYIEAAQAIETQNPENKDIKLNQVLIKAKKCINKISITAVSSNNLIVRVHTEFPEEFTIQTSEKNMPIKIYYSIKKKSESIMIKKEESDSKGRLSFTHPVQALPYKGFVTFTIDIDIEDLFGGSPKNKKKYAEIQALIQKKRVTFSYTVKAQEKTVKKNTGSLVILITGQTQEAQSAIHDFISVQLEKEGVKSIIPEGSNTATQNATFALKGEVTQKTEKEKKAFVTTTHASIKMINLETESTITKKVISKRTISYTETQSKRSGLQAIGKEISKVVLENLEE